jgi:hypothetical protein
MSNEYQNLISQNNISSIEELNIFFDEKVSGYWVELYSQESFGLAGDITIQRFFRYTFVYDFTGDPAIDGIDGCAIPDSRVVGVFGISNTEVNVGNRSMMRKYLGRSSNAYKCFEGHYDKGHFIAHHSGGPIDVNLFPHKGDVNRGWSAEGKRYRAMEKFVAANPGTFVFSRPIYKDFSCCPHEIEFGFCDRDLNFTVEKFPNR